jgi:hypothetical protein
MNIALNSGFFMKAGKLSGNHFMEPVNGLDKLNKRR